MKQVYIGKVVDVLEISGADKIESLEVVCGPGGKWRGCAQKGEFKKDDLCTVFLQDSLLPKLEEFKFMEKYKYRVRMCKFLGTPSEVLIMPYRWGNIGDDVTAEFGVEKYEKPIPANLQGQVYGNFPSFIPKTDEPNFQSSHKLVYEMIGKKIYITEKLDGTSCTMFFYPYHFGVCSRNWEKKNTDDCLYWQMAKKYNVEEKLKNNKDKLSYIAIQGEIVGPGIQKNPLKLNEHQFHVFNIWDICNQFYYSFEIMEQTLITLGLQMVPVVDRNKTFEFNSINELRLMAEGKYQSGKEREGIIIRTMNEQNINGKRASFKVINLNYKNN